MDDVWEDYGNVPTTRFGTTIGWRSARRSLDHDNSHVSLNSLTTDRPRGAARSHVDDGDTILGLLRLERRIADDSTIARSMPCITSPSASRQVGRERP